MPVVVQCNCVPFDGKGMETALYRMQLFELVVGVESVIYSLKRSIYPIASSLIQILIR